MSRWSLRTGGRRRPTPILITTIAFVALVAACGSTAKVLSQVGAPNGEGGQAIAPEPAKAGSDTTTEGRDAAAAPKDDALIVRTAQLGLQVSDVDAALTKAQQLVADLGGYIGASTRSLQDDHPVATVTYRVPVERWVDALAALRGLAGEVLSEQTDAMEVTAQAVDLDARIKNLRATESALQGVLTKAEKIPDILAVQTQLSTVREQIEVLVAQRNDLGDRAALGTIQVAYGVEVVAVTQATERWDPANEVDHATATLVDLLQALATAGIWFAIVWLPVLAVLAAIVGLIVLAVRRSGLRRRPGGPAAIAAGGGE